MFVYHCVVFLLFIANTCSGTSVHRIDRPDTGVPCEWQNVTGTCINYWTCLTNAIDAVNGEHPSVCSTSGNELMTCCTSCYVVANISDLAIVTDYLTFEIPDTKTRKKCIEYMRHYRYPCTEIENNTLIKSYIANSGCYHSWGWNMDFKEGATNEQAVEVKQNYYNMASLGYGEELETAQWLCGGSIISDRYILTAAHCRQDQALGAVRYVAVGVSNRSEPLETWQVHGIESFIPHPDYRSPLKYHDIALIKTATRITFTRTVLPACLSQGDDAWPDVGFPHLWRNDTLQQMLIIHRYDHQECVNHYSPSDELPRGFDNMTQSCFGRGTDTPTEFIQGDIGAPLQTGWCPTCVLGVTISDTRISGMDIHNGTFRRSPRPDYTPG